MAEGEATRPQVEMLDDTKTTVEGKALAARKGVGASNLGGGIQKDVKARLKWLTTKLVWKHRKSECHNLKQL